MARYVTYLFNGKKKQIPFAFNRYPDPFSAAAENENIDISHYRQMEKQVEMCAKDKQAIRNFRDKEFARMGISQVKLIKDLDNDD